ncbi:MAG: hypothetical protein V1921_08330 [Candidatus Altiarchaeota archaeon]
MKPVSDIRLRWYDDTRLQEDSPRKLIEIFLESVGISSETATDMLEALFIAKSEGRSLTTSEIKSMVEDMRGKRKAPGGLTERNIQIWLKYFRDIKLVGRVKSRHMFLNNRLPSELFDDYTRAIIDESVSYTIRSLQKIEKAYDL